MTPDDIADRLTSIVEDLDEMAFERLREAMADGERKRPEEDKQLTKARRAIERAIVTLRNIEGDTSAY